MNQETLRSACSALILWVFCFSCSFQVLFKNRLFSMNQETLSSMSLHLVVLGFELSAASSVFMVCHDAASLPAALVCCSIIDGSHTAFLPSETA